MEPLITKSELSGRWFVVTKYRIKEGIDAGTGEKSKYIVAQAKHDVTDQMRRIISQEREAARGGKRRRR